MADNHPIRLEWKKMAIEKGMEIKNTTLKYYNSGFIGWKRSDSGFINDWVATFNILSEFAGNLQRARCYDRTYPVQTANQDALNIAYMVTDSKLTTMGPEAMGFKYGLRLMAHPIGKYKPWNKKYFLEFFKGKAPSAVDMYFWYYANSTDLQPYTKYKVRRKLLTCKILKGISRFYGKNSVECCV